MKERIPQYRAYGADLRTGVECDKECRYDGNIDLFVKQHLTEEQIEPVTAHIESCPACYDYFDELSRYKKLMSGNFEESEFGDLVHDNEVVLSTITDEPDELPGDVLGQILSHYSSCTLCANEYHSTLETNKLIEKVFKLRNELRSRSRLNSGIEVK